MLEDVLQDMHHNLARAKGGLSTLSMFAASSTACELPIYGRCLRGAGANELFEERAGIRDLS